jgi:phospholipase C
MPGFELIKHLVIVMMENRSFDHYLGALNLAPEVGHPTVEGLGDGNRQLRTDIPVNRLKGTPVAPWQLDADGAALPSPPWKRVDGAWVVDPKTFDPPHEWKWVQAQFAKRKLDGFIDAYREAYYEKNKKQLPDPAARLVMGYYTRKTLPVLYALADEFAVCDHWFSSFLGSTWPNRVFVNAGHCGDLLGTDDILARYEKVFPHYIWDAWAKAGPEGRPFTWKAYFFKKREEFTMFDLWPYTHVGRSVNGADISEFKTDCDRGTLPAISIVEPNYDLFADHPWEDPVLGQHFIGAVVNALLNSPSWDDSALILTYDEHGGFYDHVPPERAPEPNTDYRFEYLGFRVPTIVMSPYTPRGAVVKTVFDHTSILKSAAERWGFVPPGPRAGKMPSVWSSGPGQCFNFAQPPRAGASIQIPDAGLELTQGAIARAAKRPPNDLSTTLSQIHRASQLGELWWL